VGESGWQNNTITNNGFDYYLIKALVGQAGSSPTVAAIGLGYDATKTFAATTRTSRRRVARSACPARRRVPAARRSSPRRSAATCSAGPTTSMRSACSRPPTRRVPRVRAGDLRIVFGGDQPGRQRHLQHRLRIGEADEHSGAVLEANRAVRLDLGCGPNKQHGFIGVDAVALEGVDIVCDLESHPWPFPTSAPRR